MDSLSKPQPIRSRYSALHHILWSKRATTDHRTRTNLSSLKGHESVFGARCSLFSLRRLVPEQPQRTGALQLLLIAWIGAAHVLRRAAGQQPPVLAPQARYAANQSVFREQSDAVGEHP